MLNEKVPASILKLSSANEKHPISNQSECFEGCILRVNIYSSDTTKEIYKN